MKTILLALAAMAFVATACGPTHIGAASEPIPSASPSSSPPPYSSPGFTVTVTEKDHATHLSVGQKLLVVLRAGKGMMSWTQPTSTDKAILAPVELDVMLPNGVTMAEFQALASGEVQVTSVDGPDCPLGEVCPMYAILYSVQVTVSGG